MKAWTQLIRSRDDEHLQWLGLVICKYIRNWVCWCSCCWLGYVNVNVNVNVNVHESEMLAHVSFYSRCHLAPGRISESLSTGPCHIVINIRLHKWVFIWLLERFVYCLRSIWYPRFLIRILFRGYERKYILRNRTWAKRFSTDTALLLRNTLITVRLALLWLLTTF